MPQLSDGVGMAGIAPDPVRQRIVEILAEQALLEPSAVTLDATLEDLGIDSLGLVEVIFGIEEAFDVQVPFNANDPAASEFDISTVETMAVAVEALISAKS